MLGESHQGEVKNITTLGRNLFCHTGAAWYWVKVNVAYVSMF
jgi:hypothetical protein